MDMSNEQLVARIQAGENTADNMLKLWQQTEGFIAKLAMSYQGYAELDDLKQEGYIGLCEAVRQYDADKGVPFINYAAFWIRQVMRRYIDNSSGVVRLPVHVKEWINKYNRVVREYQKEYGDFPSDRALCVFLGIEQKKLQAIKESIRIEQISSLSEPIGGEDKDITLYDTIASGEDLESDVIKALDTADMKRELWIAVDNLPDNLPAVVRYRYQEGKTQKQIGEIIGTTWNHARDLEQKAFRMLRREKRSRLRRYYEEYLSSAPIHHVGVASFNRTWTSSVERDALQGMFAEWYDHDFNAEMPLKEGV